MTVTAFVQVALFTAFAAALPVVFRLRSPGLRIAFWQTVLILSLLIPALPHWAAAPLLSTPAFHFAASALATSAAPAFPWLLVGAVLRCLWLMGGIYRLYSLRQSAVRDDTVWISPELAGPVSFGFRRPVILVGTQWLALPEEQQRAILTHERVHISRGDWLFHLLEEGLRTLFWFHPAIWFITAQIRLAREQVVDREALRITGDRKSYLAALLATAAENDVLMAPAFALKHHLTKRIELIQKEPIMSKRKAIITMAALTATLMVGSAVAWQIPAQAGQKAYHAGNGVSSPRVLYKIDPGYTPEAKDAKVAGTVVLTVEIGADGLATNLQIVKSLDAGLDQKAIEAVRQWRFQPGEKDGEPVPVLATLEINFKLI